MLSPFMFARRNRTDEEVAEWEAQQAKLNWGYEGSPWLNGLVTFSGFVAAFIGSVTVLLMIANLRHGLVWLWYAVIVAALVAAHLCLRVVRHQLLRRSRRL